MGEQRNKTDYLELLEKVKNLRGLEKRYYDYLPDECWKAEETQASEMGIGRSKVQRLKRSFIKSGLLNLQLKPNGKRKNPRHLISKTIPIILREREASYTRYSIGEYDDYYIDEYTYYVNDINWSLLQRYTAEDINKMSRMDKIQLYMDCGFIVLPTHYPIFTDDSVKCSCSRGLDCPQIGKHPIYRYKTINGFNYEFKKEKYLNEFRNHPEWNIGFKVMGFSVLDVDFRHNGDSTLKKLTHDYELDFKGCLASNSGGGNHIYLGNRDLKNLPNAFGEGLDTRADGGFVMAPGSVHHTRKNYEWNLIGEVITIPVEWADSESNSDEDNKDTQGFNNEAVKIKLKDIKLPKVLTSDYVIKKGERELTLFKWGSRERGQGANAEHIYDVLITLRDTYCEAGNDPMTDEEIRDIANSVVSQYPTNQEKLMAVKP